MKKIIGLFSGFSSCFPNFKYISHLLSKTAENLNIDSRYVTTYEQTGTQTSADAILRFVSYDRSMIGEYFEINS
ncbi:CLUMA_CG004898, isoform A [Clunio marinus]|uniref:CLUMA_CG004898, isoform A n=1 Tax=Clunio marinus TaxID=568069 RepID=A0A1J1HT28_9DIPT|nr:CLUMA_CG004898, isoform A [Clunio marinus]